MGPRPTRRDKLQFILALYLLFRDVDTYLDDTVRYKAAHPGQRFANFTVRSTKSHLGSCSSHCSMQGRDSCYAFNYRRSDGSCQLVMQGTVSLVEAEGYKSYAQSEFKS